jgi:hypothetical protein
VVYMSYVTCHCHCGCAHSHSGHRPYVWCWY